MIFVWDDSYNVNIQTIDDQHKKWLKLINELYEHAEGGNALGNMEYLKAAFDSAIAYTKYHLRYEEKLLLLYEYPGFKEHKKLHDDFEKKLVRFIRRFDKIAFTKPEVLLHDVILSFVDWMIDHIKSDDRNYVAFLEEKGVTDLHPTGR